MEHLDEAQEDGLEIETIIFTSSSRDEYECWEQYRNVTVATENFCRPVWDGLYCWPPVSAGKTISLPCSHIFSISDVAVSLDKGEAFRICNSEGFWEKGNWTNYTACLNLLPDLESSPTSWMAVSYIMFIGSIISLVTLVLTLFIFSYFKSLQCSRIRVHRNLVLSLILHSVMMVAISLPGIFDDVIVSFRDTSWLCKMVLTVKMYSAMTSIHWMFVEGLLLHSSITVSVFKQETPFKLYYAIGWGIPFLCVCTWVTLMSVLSTAPCWKGYGRSHFIWFITGPMILALLINTIFLINIIRILITKLRTNVSIEIKQVKKAIKATALLFPLLGITHLLFCINPKDDGHLEHAYMITNAVLQSSQGLFVAILYCFLNSEVQSVLLNFYLRSSLRRHPGRSYGRPSAMPSATMTTSLSQSEANGTRSKASLYKPASAALPLRAVAEGREDSDGSVVDSVRQVLVEKETSFIS